MATLAKLLQVEMGLPEMAERLAAAGRGKDSILAHINPREAKLLKAHGGSGKKNPRTGIVEFDDYNEDPNAGESQARNNITSIPIESSPRPQGPDLTQPAPSYRTIGAAGQQGGGEIAPAPVPAEAAPSYRTIGAAGQQGGAAPGQTDAEIAAAGERFKTPTELGFHPGGSAAPTPASLVPGTQQQPGLAQQVGQGAEKLGSYLKGINTSLEPAVPYLKSGFGLYQAYQGSQAANQAQEQAAKTEQELRGQAQQYRKQGQQLVQLGQEGKLTAPQQQLLETQRAVAAQRMASSGVTGGTAQAQIEADLSRQAANFAQQNIDQGNKLLQIADADVLKAIQTGYAQDQDAQKLANEMYRNVYAELFGGTGKTGSPGQQKIQDATEEPQ
jgi:hypothetical protein